MFGGLRGPEAESVVMFAGEDDALHAAGFERGDDGIGIEVGGIEDGGVFVAVAPLEIGEGVDGEVEEGGGFHALPAELARGGQGTERRGRGGGEKVCAGGGGSECEGGAGDEISAGGLHASLPCLKRQENYCKKRQGVGDRD